MLEQPDATSRLSDKDLLIRALIEADTASVIAWRLLRKERCSIRDCEELLNTFQDGVCAMRELHNRMRLQQPKSEQV